MPLGGGAARPPLDGAFDEARARVSPDGRWLAYVSDETGTPEVYIRRYPEFGRAAEGVERRRRTAAVASGPARAVLSVTRSVGDGGHHRRCARGVVRGASTAVPTSIAEGPSAARDSYAAMPDGRSFLIDARRDASTVPITVLRQRAAGLTPGAARRAAVRGVTEVAR